MSSRREKERCKISVNDEPVRMFLKWMMAGIK